jgi:hypothetical protein
LLLLEILKQLKSTLKTILLWNIEPSILKTRFIVILLLKNIDVLFLLRPPHISEVETYFNPLLQSAKENNIKKIVFLSVQGAEKSKIIPHIE